MTLGLDRVEELARKLAHLTGRDRESIVRAWLLASTKDRDAILSLMELECRQLTHDKDSLWLEPIPQASIGGGLRIGMVLSHHQEVYPYALPVESLLRHVTIFGQAGSGKTNLGYILLQHLLNDGMPFMVFDWKRNYRDLLALNAEANIEVYTVGRGTRPFHINPLIPPPGTSPETWLKKVTEVIARAYYVGEGVMSILHRGIDAVYDTFGVYHGSPERWPTMDDVRAWIEGYVQKASMKELKAQWVASTHRTLQSLCYGETGRVLNVDQPTRIQDLLSKPVILELDALPEAEKTLIVETLLLWIHHYRLQEKDREKLKHVLLIEEAHHVLRKEEPGARENILDVVLREIRELGEGIVMIDQSPAQFSQNAIGNSATSFVFALKDKGDVMSAANFLLLDRDQRDYLNQLPVGTCIVKLQDAYRKPFLVRLPHVRIPKGTVTDQDLLKRVFLTEEEIEGLPGTWKNVARNARRVRRATDSLKANPQLVAEVWDTARQEDDSEVFPSCSRRSRSFPAQNARSGLFRVVSRADKERTCTGIDEVHVRFLKDVVAYPYSGIRSRYERLQWNAKKGTSVKNALERAGLIRLVPVSTGQSRVLLIELTTVGQQLARHVLPDEKLLRAIRRPQNGLEHRYWKNRVAQALEREGLHVEQERRRPGGGRVDVHAENGDKVAIEIETGKSDVQGNIAKDLNAGYERVLVLPTSKRARTKVRNATRHARQARNGN